MNILAIDQGTSSTKALVVAPDGEVLGQAESAVHPRCLPPDAVEQDPEELWASLVTAGRTALERAGVRVDAIGLANQGETVLAWDRATGRPLSPAISWQDRRAAGICTRLHRHAQELQACTGLALDPYFAAPKIAWLRETLTRAGACTTTDVWLLHRLTGAFVTDATTASRTLLLDLDTVTWSARACEHFAIEPASLPAIVGCAGIVGETSVFGGSVPVAGLAVDQQASLFGQACWIPGDAKCTYGTGAFLLATTGVHARRSRSGLAACIAWQCAGETVYCLDGQAYAVGAAVSWLQRLGILKSAADLDAVAAQVTGSGGVTFVPALSGLAAPFWRPQAGGTLTGLSLSTDSAHLVRALIDGVAAQVAWLARAVGSDLGRPLACLRVDGGLTQCHTLMQAQADLLQAPVEVAASPHTTALGVAALARLGAGAAATPAAALGPRRPARIYEPRMSRDEAEARLAAWRRVAEATMDLP